MLENQLTEQDLINKYEVLMNWFEYGSRNHIEVVIGLDITRKHLHGCKTCPEYNLKLEQCRTYYKVFQKTIGNDMPIIDQTKYNQVPAV